MDRKLSIIVICVLVASLFLPLINVVYGATFGYGSLGGSNDQITNKIVGSVFSMPEWGNVTSLTAGLLGFNPYTVDSYALVKGAIYKHSDSSLVVETTEDNILINYEFPEWETLTFPVTATLEAGEDYILVVWADNQPIGGTVHVAYTSGSANQGHYDSEVYDSSYPDPLVPSHNNNKYSIYVTYTPIEAPTSSFYANVTASPEVNAEFYVNSSAYNTPQVVSCNASLAYTFTAKEWVINGSTGYTFGSWLVNGTTTLYTSAIGPYTLTANSTFQINYDLITDLYIFYGPFDEDTGQSLDQNVTINVNYAISGYTAENFTLNNDLVLPATVQVQYFRFYFEDNTTREYWIDPSESITEIYVFHGDTTDYAINFVDTVGILDTYPFIEIHRYVNGSSWVVEKRRADTSNSILASLIYSRTYTLYLGNENNEYVFGDLITSGSTSIQLVLRGVDFPKDSILLGDYVRVYATRDFDTNTITVYYEDLLTDTDSLNVFIYYNNGTVVYSYYTTSDTLTLNWNSAEDSDTYKVSVFFVHGTYGTKKFNQYLYAVSYSITSPFSLAFLGSWGFDSSFLIPALILLCVAGSFTKWNAEIGAVLMCLMAVFVSAMGWLPIPAGALVAGITFAFLMALIYSKRRGG